MIRFEMVHFTCHAFEDALKTYKGVFEQMAKQPQPEHKVVLSIKGPRKLIEAFLEDFKNSSRALVNGQDLGPTYQRWRKKVAKYLEEN